MHRDQRKAFAVSLSVFRSGVQEPSQTGSACGAIDPVDANTAGAKTSRPRRAVAINGSDGMFSLEAPQSRKKHGSIVLASLTDSLHLQQPVWHSGKVQVAAPRMSAKRVPRQQLRVASTSASGPPAFLLTQHQRAVQAALGLRHQVRQYTSHL